MLRNVSLVLTYDLILKGQNSFLLKYTYFLHNIDHPSCIKNSQKNVIQFQFKISSD